MAYTKYSLTPANNTAAPPDGAPEGMLPSAVNDTMRDMMAQIRDVGDGIRGGTYTMTAPVITGGSITGVALSGNTLTNPVITGGSINNTPIGGTTAAAGAFTTLGATGVATFSAGTVSAPAITTTGDTNTGIFFPAADTIAFTEGGVESMRIDSSGNVGIGTSSPATKLSVVGQGQFNVDANGTGTQLTLINNSQTGTVVTKLAFQNGGAVKASINAAVYNNDFMTFNTGSDTERMRIDSSGNVGIGATSSLRKLTLAGTSTSSAVTSATSWNGFQINGSIAGAGIVGITSTSGGGGGVGIGFGRGNDTDTYLTLYTNPSGGSGDAMTERMRIDSSGDLLVNTTTTRAKLTIKSAADVYASGGLALERAGVGNYWNILTASTNDLYLGYNLTDKGYFSNSTGAYTSISDKTLKKDVEGISLGLNAIKSLRPVEYLMLDDVEGTKKHLGFLAQEVQEVIPSSVSEMQSGKLGIDKSEIIPVLVKAMQEQQALIENLTNRLNALEGK